MGEGAKRTRTGAWAEEEGVASSRKTECEVGINLGAILHAEESMGSKQRRIVVVVAGDAAKGAPKSRMARRISKAPNASRLADQYSHTPLFPFIPLSRSCVWRVGERKGIHHLIATSARDSLPINSLNNYCY